MHLIGSRMKLNSLCNCKMIIDILRCTDRKENMPGGDKCRAMVRHASSGRFSSMVGFSLRSRESKLTICIFCSRTEFMGF